jgi:hypothetical protein
VITGFVLTAIPMGVVMMRVDSGALQDFLFQRHKPIGIAILPLMTAPLASECLSDGFRTRRRFVQTLCNLVCGLARFSNRVGRARPAFIVFTASVCK